MVRWWDHGTKCVYPSAGCRQCVTLVWSTRHPAAQRWSSLLEWGALAGSPRCPWRGEGKWLNAPGPDPHNSAAPVDTHTVSSCQDGAGTIWVWLAWLWLRREISCSMTEVLVVQIAHYPTRWLSQGARHLTQDCSRWGRQDLALQQPPSGLWLCGPMGEWQAIVKCFGLYGAREAQYKCSPFTIHVDAHNVLTNTRGCSIE